ncbi:MAG: T9SS type A sorting domain-containing protein [Flavobacterium sp.]|nr:T9SS type A sorting domain-containing protein [Flavobacterium sp.]
MEKLYFLAITFLFVTFSNAQSIIIPDANFKAKLLEANTTNTIAQNNNNENIKVDTNNDGEIQLSEALLVYKLNVGNSSIIDLTGIESFINLRRLNCSANQITGINAVSLTYLEWLNCANNQLTSLNMSGLTNLQSLYCNINQFSNLDASGLTNLQILNCNNNQLIDLNLSGLINLQYLDCVYNQLPSLNLSDSNNLISLTCHNNQLSSLNVSNAANMNWLDCYANQLTSLFIKNDNLSWQSLMFQGNPNLQYVCADEADIALVQLKINQYGYTNCHVNSYCSFTPGETFYTIQGSDRIDSNNDGCNTLDVIYPNLKFVISNGSISGTLISNNSGNYSIPIQAGTHTITPQFENPSYFLVSPASATVTFPSTASPFTQNFCIMPNGVFHDLEILLIPVGVARPGFDATYKIKYKNKGNQIENFASINFNFNDAILDYVSSSLTPSSQIVNMLSWNIGNILPFQSGEITITFNVNSPMETPAVNVGDLLNYSLIINLATDINQDDNIFSYDQTVVNSYDPNDKECLQGPIINPNMIGNYINYKIRFENTGTYPAQNIVIKDIIDTNKFELSTLQMIDASHSCVTRITNPNKVEFIFENINLPFDDASNDGYVVFKIKTLSTLVENSTISNNASIYFDYNFPIVTNTATSIFASLETNEFENTSVVVYPNPTNDIININCNDMIKNISLYDIQGRLLLSKIIDSQSAILELTNKNSGIYFIKVITVNGMKVEKILKP